MTYFKDVQVGQFFKIEYDEPNAPILQRIPEGTVKTWPNANYLNTENGLFGSAGPIAPVSEIITQPTNTNYQWHEGTQYPHERVLHDPPAKPYQIEYLKEHNIDTPEGCTWQMAEDLITQSKPTCHYCGQPASGFGFFGEHTCHECDA